MPQNLTLEIALEADIILVDEASCKSHNIILTTRNCFIKAYKSSKNLINFAKEVL